MNIDIYLIVREGSGTEDLQNRLKRKGAINITESSVESMMTQAKFDAGGKILTSNYESQRQLLGEMGLKPGDRRISLKIDVEQYEEITKLGLEYASVKKVQINKE